MSKKNITLDNYKGFWASVYIDSGDIRDVTYAKGKSMADTLLLTSYTDELKKLVEVKPVDITVLDIS